MRCLLLTLALIASLAASPVRAADATPAVPSWMSDATWYQIFPERFRNGDPRNDPTAAEVETRPGREFQITPWTSDWYQLQPWEQATGRKFYDVVNERRYGGDLQGVVDKLDYLKKLGINTLYLNPIFEAFSLHKYDASNMHHVDNNFGPDAAGDLTLMRDEGKNPADWKWSAADKLFLKLIREAHQRGMRVVIDGVFNHAGMRFFAFEDLARNQQRSAYTNWFTVTRWDDPATPRNEFAYRGWWGIRDLPEFKRDADNLHPEPRAYIFAITRRWMDPNGDGNPNDGVDGWRLDAAEQAPHGFWKDWRRLVKSINPQACVVGELWEDPTAWLQGDEFDAVMNYRFAKACIRFFIDRQPTNQLTASAFLAELEKNQSTLAAPVNYAMMNLYDSHDTPRLATLIANPDHKDNGRSNPRADPNYDITKPTAAAWQTQRLMLLFQVAAVGAPVTYYGDEAGMWGATDPDERKPMVWPEMKFDPESNHPIPGRTRVANDIAFDSELHDYYQRLLNIRLAQPALRRGTFTTLLTEDANSLFAFRRDYSGETILGVINNDSVSHEVSLPVTATKYRDLVGGRDLRSPDGKTLKVTVAAKSGLLIKRE